MNKIQFINTICIILFLSSYVEGHSGGTDSKGGHHDRKRGGYHYHHGNRPHQHPGGLCELSNTLKNTQSNHDSDLPYGQLLLMGGIAAFCYSKREKTMQK